MLAKKFIRGVVRLSICLSNPSVMIKSNGVNACTAPLPSDQLFYPVSHQRISISAPTQKHIREERKHRYFAWFDAVFPIKMN